MADLRTVGVLVAAALAAVMLFGEVGVAHAADSYLIDEGSWVCGSRQDYQRTLSEGPEAKDELVAARLCLVFGEDEIDDMMQPYLRIVDRRNDLVKVRFTIEYHDRIELLHRRISRVTYAGWTGADQLRPYSLFGSPR